MGIYYVEIEDLVVDGNTFCGGSPCSASDTIIIRGGSRGSIWFKNFNGNGAYISVLNENINPAARVVITSSTQSAFLIEDCKYLYFHGDNDIDITYGIKSINDGTPSSTNNVRILGESDHIKISYFEIAFDGNTTGSGNGIFIQDSTVDNTWIWDTIEIHHNYIHGSRYAGMYLGQEWPHSNNNPYIANVSVHDNILEDIGSYGMDLKGVHPTSGVCTIYNNTIDTTGLVYVDPDFSAHAGISVQQFYGAAYANIYNNTIINTKGVGIRISHENHNIYDNLVLGCGTSNHASYGHGIVVRDSADNIEIYDNIIIQPTRYGIYALGGADIGGTIISRNLIGNAGVGEWDETVSGQIIESADADANIYHADVADFGFNAWSDDGDYSNDDFTFPSDIDELERFINIVGAISKTGFQGYLDVNTSLPIGMSVGATDIQTYNAEDLSIASSITITNFDGEPISEIDLPVYIASTVSNSDIWTYLEYDLLISPIIVFTVTDLLAGIEDATVLMSLDVIEAGSPSYFDDGFVQIYCNVNEVDVYKVPSVIVSNYFLISRTTNYYIVSS